MFFDTIYTKKSNECKTDYSSDFASNSVSLQKKSFYDYTSEQNETKLWLDDYGWI